MSSDFRHLIIWAVFLILPLCIAVTTAMYCLSAPSRRRERARLFLDLLETALQNGQSPEHAITSISETRDPSVTPHFHLLAAHIEEGANLGQALHLTPRLLPRAVAEIVKIGADENAFDQLLPAARAMLTGVNSQMRGALNYVILLFLVVLPGTLVAIPLISIFIWPKLKQILEDMEIPMPILPEMLFDNYSVVTKIEWVLFAFILMWVIFYVGGPRLAMWARTPFGGILDRCTLLIPWRRRRAQRDFTGVLAVLLDAGLEETRAVQLAARATGNAVFSRRADRVVEKIRQGITLPEALKDLENNSEFQWRWANALRSGQGFFAALRGWHESLEARAFQQEQAAAHVITSGIVIINGALVGLVCASVFLIIISIIEEGTMW